MKLKMKTILFDNYPGCGYDFSEMKNNLEECNSCTMTDEQVWQYIGWCEQDDWNAMLEELSTIENANNWIARGKVGRWNGTSEGWSVFSTAETMLCALGKDCEYYSIYIKEGSLHIECSHHDGKNYAECRLLTYDGNFIWDEWSSLCGENAHLQEDEMLDLLWDNHTIKIENL